MDIIGQVYYIRVVNEQKSYHANIYGSTNTPTHIQLQSVYFTHNFVPMVTRQVVVPQVNELEGTTILIMLLKLMMFHVELITI